MKITKTHNQANLASKKENKTLQAGYPLYAFDTDGIKDSNEPFSVIELLLLNWGSTFVIFVNKSHSYT